MSSVSRVTKADLYSPEFDGLYFGDSRYGGGYVTPPIDVRQEPVYTDLPDEQQRVALHTGKIINHWLKTGHVNPENIGSILEFGTGNGTASIVVKKLCQQAGAVYQAVELEEEKAEQALQRGIMHPAELYMGDGFELMEEAISSGETFDLVTAIAFGPDQSEAAPLSNQFFSLLPHILGESGVAVINSDWRTYYYATKAAHELGISRVDSSDPYISTGLTIMGRSAIYGADHSA